MDRPAEILLFDFLKESIEASDPDSALYPLELHDTVYQAITKDKGVRISDAASTFSPGPGMEIQEFDTLVILTCFSKVDGGDQKDRQPALVEVWHINKAIYELLINDPTLGGRVCECRPGRGTRGYDKTDAGLFAVSNMPLIIDPREQRIAE